jgi:LuxR family maltose regulon positive regulatory protein
MGTGSRYRQVSVPVARNVVRRARLFGLLDAVVSTPVVLVCAPAGSGKSLLVASWWTDRAFRYGGWVNVSAARNSAGEVWHSILQALQPADPDPDPDSGSGAGAGPDSGEVWAGLEAVALRAPQDVPAGLGRWLVERGLDTYLVVDDLHAVGDLAVQEQLVELVVASAGRLHLVAVARHDPPWPLHRMRLDGLLVNVRAESLAFDPAEAAELFASLGVAVTAGRVGPDPSSWTRRIPHP